MTPSNSQGALGRAVSSAALLVLLLSCITACPEPKPGNTTSTSPEASSSPTQPPRTVTPKEILDTNVTPVLKWSVPGRYDASWGAFNLRSGDYDRKFVNPQFWPIKLDACKSKSKFPIVGYTVRLRRPASDAPEFKLPSLNQRESKGLRNDAPVLTWPGNVTPEFEGTFRSCRINVEKALRAEGQYVADLTIHTEWPGGEKRASRVHSEPVKIDDRLIVVMGDSLAAGEGVPDRRGRYTPQEDWKGKIVSATQKTPAQWANRQCHRSKKSGPALAAKAFENEHTSVTFLSVACSGAQIWHLLDTPYRGIWPYRDWWIPPQTDVIHRATQPDLLGRGGRQIDALIVSAGINDLYFGDIVNECAADILRTEGNCVTHQVCWPGGLRHDKRPGHYDATYVEPDRIAVPVGHPGPVHVRCFGDGTIGGQVDELKSKYRILAEEIRRELSNVREVFINDYPATVFEGGACGKLHIKKGIGIGEKEGLSMYNWGIRLSDKVAEAGNRYRGDEDRWNRIDELTRVFRGHHYCKPEGRAGWFNRYETSWRTQGDEKGTAHPNESGHVEYGKVLHSAIAKDVNVKPWVKLTIKVEELKSNKYDRILLAVQQYQKDEFYPVSTVATVPTNGQWTRIPPEVGTFHLVVYQSPAAPRRATQMELKLGGQISIRHTRDDVYGAGVRQHLKVDGEYGIEVKYSVKLESAA